VDRESALGEKIANIQSTLQADEEVKQQEYE